MLVRSVAGLALRAYPDWGIVGKANLRPFVGFCPMWVQSLLLPRVMRWVHELRPRRAGAGDLKDHGFVLGHQEVVDVGWLSPKAARRQGLQLRLIECVPESDVQG